MCKQWGVERTARDAWGLRMRLPSNMHRDVGVALPRRPWHRMRGHTHVLHRMRWSCVLWSNPRRPCLRTSGVAATPRLPCACGRLAVLRLALPALGCPVVACIPWCRRACVRLGVALCFSPCASLPSGCAVCRQPSVARTHHALAQCRLARWLLLYSSHMCVPLLCVPMLLLLLVLVLLPLLYVCAPCVVVWCGVVYADTLLCGTMFSKMNRLAAPAARAAIRPRTLALPRQLVAAIHTAAPAWAEAVADASALNIDKTNPLYAPDAWDDWMNTGYKNLASKDHREWKDLPFPYKYYDVKVDPADVESKGLLWNIFTDWRTALPATGLLALPMYVYDVFVLDERVMLALITWFTFALLRTQVGPSLGAGLKQTALDEAKELYDVESAYRSALTKTATAHKNVLDLVKDLKAKHAADRALKELEARAASREVQVEQTLKMKAMLDYLVLAKAETVASAQDSVVESSFQFVADVRSCCAAVACCLLLLLLLPPPLLLLLAAGCQRSMCALPPTEIEVRLEVPAAVDQRRARNLGRQHELRGHVRRLKLPRQDEHHRRRHDRRRRARGGA